MLNLTYKQSKIQNSTAHHQNRLKRKGVENRHKHGNMCTKKPV